MDNTNALDSVPRLLWSNLKAVLECEDLGISKTHIKLASVDRTNFSFNIPYAARELLWEVSFLEDDLSFAPDFYFDDEFLNDPEDNIIELSLQSFSSWHIENANSLLNIIRDLLSLYSVFQWNRFMVDLKATKLVSEYNQLLNSTTIRKEDLEIVTVRNAVSMFISVNVDFSALPAYSHPFVLNTMLNLGGNVAYLRLLFELNGRRCKSELVLSPRVELALGGCATMNIPDYTLDMTLYKYVAQIQDLLQTKVASMVDHYNRKQEFIRQFVSLHPNRILECDEEKFEYVSVLYGDIENDGIAVLSITIEQTFPKERPKVRLSSVYKEQKGKPTSVSILSYNYSPNHTVGVMITNIMTKLNESMKMFK